MGFVSDLPRDHTALTADGRDPHRDLVWAQIRDAARALHPEESAEHEEAAQQEAGMLAAWEGLAEDGDAVEQMLAAQMIATHGLAMITLQRAMARAGKGSYFGESIRDAGRVLAANLRQVETLARYRTWKMRMERDRVVGPPPPEETMDSL